MCCLSKPDDRPELDGIRNKWVTPKELIKVQSFWNSFFYIYWILSFFRDLFCLFWELWVTVTVSLIWPMYWQWFLRSWRRRASTCSLQKTPPNMSAFRTRSEKELVQHWWFHKTFVSRIHVNVIKIFSINMSKKKKSLYLLIMISIIFT